VIVESGEKVEDVIFDGVPEGGVEARAESVRARTGVGVHTLESALDLKLSEGLREGWRKVHVSARVEVTEVEVPVRVYRIAKEGCVICVQDSSLVFMLEKFSPIVL
jgi:hypothetical protein